MKTLIASVWLLMLALPAAPGADGVAQNGAGAGAAVAPTTSLTSTATSPLQGYVSGWLREVIKLAQAGVDESTMLSFVESAGTFSLGAEEIIYLRDLGISSAVINAMILHDADLASGLRPMPTTVVPGSAPTIPVAAPGALATSRPKQSPAGPAQETASRPGSEAPSQPELDEWAARSDFGEEEWAVAEENVPEAGGPTAEAAHAATPSITSTPVRAPYAVRLTDPILVYPTEPRLPNIVTIEFIR